MYCRAFRRLLPLLVDPGGLAARHGLASQQPGHYCTQDMKVFVGPAPALTTVLDSLWQEVGPGPAGDWITTGIRPAGASAGDWITTGMGPSQRSPMGTDDDFFFCSWASGCVWAPSRASRCHAWAGSRQGSSNQRLRIRKWTSCCWRQRPQAARHNLVLVRPPEGCHARTDVNLVIMLARHGRQAPARDS